MASVCEICRKCDFVSYLIVQAPLKKMSILMQPFAKSCTDLFMKRLYSDSNSDSLPFSFSQPVSQRLYSRPYVHLTFNRLLYTWCLLALNNTFFRTIFYFKEWYKVIRGKLSRGKSHLGHITVAIGSSDVLTPRSTTFPTVRTQILHVVGHGRVGLGLPS